MRKLEELAAIFNYKETNKLQHFIPTKIVEGFFDETNDVFVDSKGYSYIHLTNISMQNGFGLNETIENLEKKYPNKTLKEIKKAYLQDIRQYDYYYGVIEDKLSIITEDKKTNEKWLYSDKYLEETGYYIASNSSLEDGETELDEYEKMYGEMVADSKPIIKNNIIEHEKIEFSKKNIKDELKKQIIGQDIAINKIMTIIFEHYNSNYNDKSENILVIGPTGSGKTQIFRSISTLLNVPILIIDANDYTAEGYIGKSVNTILEDLLKLTDGNIEKAQNAILVIDEIDKLASKNESNKADVKTDMVQQGLLKIIEDGKKQVYYQKRKYEFDTTHLLTVGLGAFSGLNNQTIKVNQIGFGNNFVSKTITKEKNIEISDLTKYGLIPEFLGRFSNLVLLNELTEENLFDIMKYSDLSIMKKKERYLTKLGINFTYSDEVLKKIAAFAVKNKEGARSLNKTLNNVLFDALDELTDSPEEYKELEILPETVDNSKKYVLKRK